jgi:hypothetical protein
VSSVGNYGTVGELQHRLKGPLAFLLILTLVSKMWFMDKVGPAGVTTPLHMAALNGDASGIEHRLDAGADPNLPDSTGATPLFLRQCEASGKLPNCCSAEGPGSTAGTLPARRR